MIVRGARSLRSLPLPAPASWLHLPERRRPVARIHLAFQRGGAELSWAESSIAVAQTDRAAHREATPPWPPAVSEGSWSFRLIGRGNGCRIFDKRAKVARAVAAALDGGTLRRASGERATRRDCAEGCVRSVRAPVR